jgi:peptidoglycan hydrolase-like protein with peptidoglycan-binding domain
MLARLSFRIALATTALFGAGAQAQTLDPLQIFVSKDKQQLVVYDGDQVVATSHVSTGKPGHATPSGIFSIIEKSRMHNSNLYESAPMPFMQRITWDGVALHESNSVPRYPASHGCVRMPGDFASQLWDMTTRGFHVVITERELTPHAMQAAGLFMPRYARPDVQTMSDADLRPAISANPGAEVAMNETLPKLGATAVATLPKDNDPIKILITRPSQQSSTMAAQQMLAQLGYDVGDADGYLGDQTRAAIKAYQAIHSQKQTGTLTPKFVASIYKVLNRKQPNAWLYVRRNFKPVFDAPVEISDPSLALGTHFIEAVHVNMAQNSADWVGVTLDNYIPSKTAKRLGITRFGDAEAPDAAEQAFARVTIPDDVRARIETMLGNGSSITITDTGTESKTGDGTDFITVTRDSAHSDNSYQDNLTVKNPDDDIGGDIGNYWN